MPSIDRARRWVAILLAIYAALVMLVAAIPRPIQTGLTPRIRGVLAWMHRHGLRDWIDYEFVEYALHVVLFVPLGILLAVALGRRLVWLAVLTGLGAGVLGELWTSRFADEAPSPVDLMLNAAGAIVGVALGYAILRGVRRRSTQPR